MRTVRGLPYVEYQRRYHIQSRYGIDFEVYDAMIAAGCAICGRTEEDARGAGVHLDHDHETGAIRGVLCGSCNRGLGMFRDDPELLSAAIAYLAEFCNRAPRKKEE